MVYSLTEDEFERRLTADRESEATDQSDTVWVSAAARWANCYHDEMECKQAKRVTTLCERLRSEAQRAGLAPCPECCPPLTPERPDGDFSTYNALRSADSFDELAGGND